MGLEAWLGEISALLGALLWAIASVLYGRVGVKIPPLLLNLAKGAIAILALGLTIWARQAEIPTVEGVVTGQLCLSGVIGIGLGDTAYLAALTRLGVRRALLLETLAPPISALLAWLLLDEHLSAIAIVGIILILCGVSWVITERTRGSATSPQPGHSRSEHLGLFWGVLAELAQGSGAVLSRQALAQSTMTPLWSSLIRLLGGEVILLLLLAWGWFKTRTTTHRPPNPIPWTPESITAIIFASLGGTYLGIWLQQTALKFTTAGVAQTLLATSPLFVLPIVTLLGEKTTARSWLGVAIAIMGIALLFNT